MVNKDVFDAAVDAVKDSDTQVIKQLADILDGKDVPDVIRNLSDLLSICLEQAVRDEIWINPKANIESIDLCGRLKSLAESLAIEAIQQKINDITKSN